MDRIKSQNCGSRAWSKVILGQAPDLKTVRRRPDCIALPLENDIVRTGCARRILAATGRLSQAGYRCNFELSDEERMTQEMAAKFAVRELRPGRRNWTAPKTAAFCSPTSKSWPISVSWG